MSFRAVESELEHIRNRYDPEQDVPGPYNHPMVSATEYGLMYAIEQLMEEVKKQQTQIEALQHHCEMLDMQIPA